MKVDFKRIDHVQLAIPKGTEDKARDFYGGLLGLGEIEKPDSLKPTGGVWYKIGDAELHLGIIPVLDQTPAAAPKKEHPAFVVSGLLDVKSYLEQNGVKMKEEVPIPGRERFSFYDPFGNRIELLEFN